jgi:hypothetical protein
MSLVERKGRLHRSDFVITGSSRRSAHPCASTTPAQAGRLLRRIRMQWRFVTDQPDVTKGISEPTLSMDSPRPLVIFKIVQAAFGASGQGACDYVIGIVTEEFDPRSSDAKLQRAFPPVPRRLAQEKRGTADFDSRDGTETPKHFGIECALVPLDRAWCIFNRQHHGDHRPKDWSFHDEDITSELGRERTGFRPLFDRLLGDETVAIVRCLTGKSTSSSQLRRASDFAIPSLK